VQGHVLSDDPANNDEERSHEQSDLDAGTNGDTHGKIHLVADCNHNSSSVLGYISNNRDKNQTNESLADLSTLGNVVDTTDEEFGANGDE
jgi:hypothetical protein